MRRKISRSGTRGSPSGCARRSRGARPVNLLAKASRTGTNEHNRQLAHRRAKHVEDILVDLASSDAKFHTQAIGRSQPHQQGEVQEERVVLISLGDDAPAAVVADE